MHHRWNWLGIWGTFLELCIEEAQTFLVQNSYDINVISMRQYFFIYSKINVCIGAHPSLSGCDSSAVKIGSQGPSGDSDMDAINFFVPPCSFLIFLSCSSFTFFVQPRSIITSASVLLVPSGTNQSSSSSSVQLSVSMLSAVSLVWLWMICPFGHPKFSF